MRPGRRAPGARGAKGPGRPGPGRERAAGARRGRDARRRVRALPGTGVRGGRGPARPAVIAAPTGAGRPGAARRAGGARVGQCGLGPDDARAGPGADRQPRRRRPPAGPSPRPPRARRLAFPKFLLKLFSSRHSHSLPSLVFKIGSFPRRAEVKYSVGLFGSFVHPPGPGRAQLMSSSTSNVWKSWLS